MVIGLGSIFLVKFAIDQGFLGPAVRDTLTFLLGFALVIGGEWLRRRPLQRAIAAIRPNYVPLALTASGLFAAFASIYAAHVFHGLLGPLPALAGLAIVAFVAVGLSLLQGKFVALLGLLGASATPLLIATPDPSLWALLTYLLVIQAACLSLVRYQGWWSLGFGTLAMAMAWPLLIWSRHHGLGDAEVIPLGIYLLLSASAFFVLRHLLQGSTVSLSGQNWTVKLEKRPIDALAWGGRLDRRYYNFSRGAVGRFQLRFADFAGCVFRALSHRRPIHGNSRRPRCCCRSSNPRVDRHLAATLHRAGRDRGDRGFHLIRRAVRRRGICRAMGRGATGLMGWSVDCRTALTARHCVLVGR